MNWEGAIAVASAVIAIDAQAKIAEQRPVEKAD